MLQGNVIQQVESLPGPDLSADTDSEFRAKWLRWEMEVREKAVLLHGVLNDSIKIARVRRRAPLELRCHLKLTANSYGESYSIFREVVDGLLGVGEAEEQVEQPTSCQNPPMDLGTLAVPRARG